MGQEPKLGGQLGGPWSPGWGGGSLEAVVSAGVVRKRTESAGVGDKAEVTHCWPGGEGGQRITRVNNDPSAGDYISG